MTIVQNKILFAGVVVALLATMVAVLVATQGAAEAAEYPQQSMRPIAHASSTAYALTGGATGSRVVATSTRMAATDTLPATVGRTALALQTINCAATGHVWLAFNDTLAATSSTYFLAASSTLILGDTLPMVHGSIRAMAGSANCTLLVTEFRSEY